MSQTMRQRSQLVQAAEYAHNQKERPTNIDEIVFAVPNPKTTISASIIFAVCFVFVVSFMVGKFLQQLIQVIA